MLSANALNRRPNGRCHEFGSVNAGIAVLLTSTILLGCYTYLAVASPATCKIKMSRPQGQDRPLGIGSQSVGLTLRPRAHTFSPGGAQFGYLWLVGVGLASRGTRHTGPRWSTASIPVPEQFAYWRDVVCQAFVALHPQRVGCGPFAGTIEAQALGSLTLSRISSQGQHVRRTQASVDQRAGDVMYVNIQLRGTGSASQDGRTAQQQPGDLALLDSTRPFELGFDGDFEQLCVTLPVDLLVARLAVPQAVTAVSIPGRTGLGAMITNQLRFFADNGCDLDIEASRYVAGQLTDVLALALGRAQSVPGHSARALLLQAALDEVERRLGDPQLSPTDVAQRVNVSTRYLHRLFADRGTSFGRWILARRLERCHRDLVEPAFAHMTVGQIAARHGFTDRTHFARAFRGRYGLTPSSHRRRPAGATNCIE
jgi:AraC family transcriptional regulator, positive regulator of tynA and feaB